MIPRIRTIRETAEYCRQEDPMTYVTEPWLRKQIKLGVIPFFKSGNRALISLEDLEKILSENRFMISKVSVIETRSARMRKID